MQKIDWCEVGMQLEDIVTNNVSENVSENFLNPRKQDIIVRLEN